MAKTSDEQLQKMLLIIDTLKAQGNIEAAAEEANKIMAEIMKYTSTPTDADVIAMKGNWEEKIFLDDLTYMWPKNHLIKIERGRSSQIPDGFYKATRVIQ